jgi:hypothetical protein
MNRAKFYDAQGNLAVCHRLTQGKGSPRTLLAVGAAMAKKGLYQFGKRPKKSRGRA